MVYRRLDVEGRSAFFRLCGHVKGLQFLHLLRSCGCPILHATHCCREQYDMFEYDWTYLFLNSYAKLFQDNSGTLVRGQLVAVLDKDLQHRVHMAP